jgi:hypothetical protein
MTARYGKIGVAEYRVARRCANTPGLDTRTWEVQMHPQSTHLRYFFAPLSPFLLDTGRS